MSEPTAPLEAWTGGTAYEAYVGRWSRRVAPAFVPWLAIPPGARWLDVGCGTGALSAAILQATAPRAITALDRSAAYAAHARAQLPDARAHVAVGDAQALPFASGTFDGVVSGLMLNFVPDPAQAVAEMRRVARPGGTAAVYVWDYAGEMQFMRYFWDAAAALDPAAAALDEGTRFALCRPDALTALFQAAGLQDVAVSLVDVVTDFRDFDDYWTPFLGGQGSAPGYLMSLPEARRAALRDHLRATLPIRPDGTIPLLARAWAVRGTRA